MARPKKEIDEKEFEKLCSLQCTKEEICAWLHITDKTLDRWCKEKYNSSFSEIFKIKRGLGKISLRRYQFQLAQKNAAMAIWLGKQYLDQREPGDSGIIELQESPEFASMTDKELDDWIEGHKN